MDIEEEIQIEYVRLRRHIRTLQKGVYRKHVVRDLAVTLRCWNELSNKIDDKLGARKFSNNNLMIQEKSITGSVHYYEFIRLANMPRLSKGLLVGNVSFHNMALNPSEVAAQSKPQQNNYTIMKLNKWLDKYVCRTIGTKNNLIDISRRLYIERCANTFGGAHPINSNDKNNLSNEQKEADKVITSQMHNETIGVFPTPYALLVDTGLELLNVYSDLEFAQYPNDGC